MAYRLCTEKRVGSKKFSTGFSGFEKGPGFNQDQRGAPRLVG